MSKTNTAKKATKRTTSKVRTNAAIPTAPKSVTEIPKAAKDFFTRCGTTRVTSAALRKQDGAKRVLLPMPTDLLASVKDAAAKEGVSVRAFLRAAAEEKVARKSRKAS